MPIFRHMIDMAAVNTQCVAASAKVQRVRRYEGSFVVETNAILTALERTTIKAILDSPPSVLVREAPELDH